MIFHNDTAPSSPDALHALLRHQLSFVDEPREIGTNRVVEESRATNEMQPIPGSLSLPSTTSTPEASAAVHNEERMTLAMPRSEHSDCWFRPREERKQHRRRRFTPPVTSFDHFEDDERNGTTFEGLVEVPPVVADDRRTTNTSGVGLLAGSSKKKRGHRRNNCILMGDSFGFA